MLLLARRAIHSSFERCAAVRPVESAANASFLAWARLARVSRSMTGRVGATIPATAHLGGKQGDQCQTVVRSAGLVDLVLVWRLDRWGRSLVDLVSTLQPRSGSSIPACDRQPNDSGVCVEGRGLTGWVKCEAVAAANEYGPLEAFGCRQLPDLGSGVDGARSGLRVLEQSAGPPDAERPGPGLACWPCSRNSKETFCGIGSRPASIKPARRAGRTGDLKQRASLSWK